MSETTSLPDQIQPGYQPPLPGSSNDTSAQLPDRLQSGYRTPMPYQLAGASTTAPSTPTPPDQRNYTVGPVRPGDPGYQPPTPPGQQGTDPRARAPDEYHLGQPIWHPRPGEQGYSPTDVALSRPPAFQQGHQPGPWPAAYPNSPRFDPTNAPALPGETQQETADLNRHLGHETGNRGNIINDWAARDPSRYYQGQTCSGYWQITNSTWRDGAQRAGVNLNQYPTAMSAPYQVQRQVALALYRSYGNRPWDPQPGAGERGDQAALRPQLPTPPEPRGYQDWGKDPPLTAAPPRDFGQGPPGQQQGPFGQANFMQPGQSGFTRVLNAVGPLLLGIASLALRLPLSTAITAYGAMARAQDNGQREAYQRARTQFQDQLKEANAQQALESQAASDAFGEYGNNNPAGLQQRLAQIALQYNDPTMFRMAERGDLNGIHQLQTRRDMYNQDLTKLNKAAQDEQDRQAENAAVTAMDHQWHDDFVAKNGREPTPDETAIAHNENIGKAARAGTKTDTTDAEEATLYNVIGPDGKDTGKQVREGKTGGMRDASTGQPYTKQPGETFERAPSERPESTGPKPSDYKDYTWDDPEGKHHGPSSAAMVPGKGLVDPMGNPIPAKPETIRTVTAATSTPAESYPHEAGQSDYPDRPNRPPPGTDITDGEWRQALTYVNTGKAPTFARDRQAMARFREIIPVAMRAMGVTEDQMDRRWVDYAAYKTRQQRIEAAFAGGQDGKTLLALNTVAHHIDLFRQYADAMRNGDVPRMNQVIDNLAREGGAPELMDFNIVSRVTGDELVRVLTGTGGGTITDREDIAHQLSAYSSPEQFEGAANTLTNVLRGRFGPLQRAYSYGDPAKEKFFQENMMEPEARRMFQGEQQRIPGADPSQQPRQFPTPPPEAVQQLKGDPGSRAHFDEVFGPGAAAKVLGQ